jgi:endonuclease-3
MPENFAETIEDYARRAAKYAPVDAALRAVYGPLDWQDGTDPMEELVSCILSQNTNDANRDRAFFAMRERYPTWQSVVDAPTDELIDTLRPAGLANQKAPRIQRVLERIHEERGAYNIDFLRDMTLDEARAWLVSFDGIGPKTAAIVLCFAFGRPAFPVDTHIYRVGQRLGFIPAHFNVERAHPLMEALVPDYQHYAFHIYLIRHGRDTCNARKPHCERCPLRPVCDYYVTEVQGGSLK